MTQVQSYTTFWMIPIDYIPTKIIFLSFPAIASKPRLSLQSGVPQTDPQQLSNTVVHTIWFLHINVYHPKS
jgi:hypothetical protein